MWIMLEKIIYIQSYKLIVYAHVYFYKFIIFADILSFSQKHF